ncbi:TPA: cupin domain-containing protein [Enterobacter hormaechei subsp. steigerwaltii]|nr:cupin domain-containing protein [Enterobacter hormaechei subsp. steigerwaltii]
MSKKCLASLALASMALTGAVEAAMDDVRIFPSGSAPTMSGPEENFSGRVNVDLLTPPEVKTPASSGLVSFAPGARTAWHTHPAGQMLIVTAGKGWVQEDGQARQVIKTGDIVWIPANVRHWHGATAQNAMSHIAITYIKDGKNADWQELVTDEQYSQQ